MSRLDWCLVLWAGSNVVRMWTPGGRCWPSVPCSSTHHSRSTSLLLCSPLGSSESYGSQPRRMIYIKWCTSFPSTSSLQIFLDNYSVVFCDHPETNRDLDVVGLPVTRPDPRGEWVTGRGGRAGREQNVPGSLLPHTSQHTTQSFTSPSWSLGLPKDSLARRFVGLHQPPQIQQLSLYTCGGVVESCRGRAAGPWEALHPLGLLACNLSCIYDLDIHLYFFR